MVANGDMEAAEMRNLQWLVSSPKFTQDVSGMTVTGDHGGARPRAFALHKLWLSLS